MTKEKKSKKTNDRVDTGSEHLYFAGDGRRFIDKSKEREQK